MGGGSGAETLNKVGRVYSFQSVQAFLLGAESEGR